MKYIALIVILFLGQQISGQEQVDYYQIGMIHAGEGEYKLAIKNFIEELEQEPENHLAWYNKALCEYFLYNIDKAILDLDSAIESNSEYSEAYLNRALLKAEMTDYEGALIDLNTCLDIDENFNEVYLHRGVLNEYLMHYDQACKDLSKAVELGIEEAKRFIEISCSPEREANYANVLKLTRISQDTTYGYSGDNPIKVGTGLRGGPSNQREYLNLLRDSHGNSVGYERKGSCCHYASENAIFGSAATDIYEITFLNKDGLEEKVLLHISFYDYEEPIIPIGFQTIKAMNTQKIDKGK